MIAGSHLAFLLVTISAPVRVAGTRTIEASHVSTAARDHGVPPAVQ